MNPENEDDGFWLIVRMAVKNRRDAKGRTRSHRGYLNTVESSIQTAVAKANKKYFMRSVRLEITAEPYPDDLKPKQELADFYVVQER